MSTPADPAAAPGNPLVSYMRAMRAHPFVILGVVLAAVAGAAFFTRTRSYEATAQILVTPIAPPDRSFIDLPLPRAVGDPARVTQTEADVVDSPEAATVAAKTVQGESPGGIDSSTTVTPSSTGDVVEVTARASSPTRAADIANAYARAALKVRARALRPLVAQSLKATTSALAEAPDPNSESAQMLRERLVDLQSIQDGTDPTLSLTEAAVPPSGPTGLSRSLVLGLALIAGLAIGLVASLLVELLVPRRLKTEFDVLHVYGLPVLARVPLVRGRKWDPDRPLDQAPLAVDNAFRALRTQLEVRQARHSGDGAAPVAPGGRVVGIASASRGAGGTSVSIGLALALLRRGQNVLLVDLDLAAPAIAPRLRFEPRRDLASLLADESSGLPDVVTPVDRVPDLAVVAAPPVTDLAIAERISARVPQILDAARSLADWVIVDVGPVNQFSELLTIGYISDDLILVSRLGLTDEVALTAARDLMESLELVPAGHVLVGAGPSERKRVKMTRGLRPAAERSAGPAQS
jgi:Mrp family chromosome partitioning ATPase/capsular polysaccharide biosynthesis protein